MAWTRYLHLLLQLGCVWSLETACEMDGLPMACYPPLEPNIIPNLQPAASNTCGLDGPERVCYQMGAGGGIAGTCDFCDANVPELAHPPAFMTDPHSDAGGNLTYWQSQNFSVVQYPHSVVITFPLSKTFDIIRVAITFQSPRPESYAIYKSTDYGVTFEPFHYFSLSCEATYGVEEGTSVALGEEAIALCTSEEAQMTPLSGGEAVFQPLLFRPSAESFIDSAELQEWVRATDIQLRLDRLNTFGDAALTSDPDVIASYFYAISNVEVSGRCFCNGHAASCTGSVAEEDAVCECEHSTAGPDCGVCREFYQDLPWAPATADSPTECAACDCNNHSSVCRFDMEQYLASGNVSGGVCAECGDNTEGLNCQSCRLGYYTNSDLPFTSTDACVACDCDPLGTVGGESSCLQTPSVSPTPSSRTNGQCPCKVNVEGRRCSQCRDGYHTLDIDNPDGCLPCTCVEAGTINASSLCDKHSGECECVPTVGGRDCEQCLPGYFNFDPQASPPCRECSCYVGGATDNACSPSSGDCQCRRNVGGVVSSLSETERVVCDSPLPEFYCAGLELVFEGEGETVDGVEVVLGSNGELYTGSGFVQLAESGSVTVSEISVPFCGQYDLFLRHSRPEASETLVRIEISVLHPPDLPPTSLPCAPLEREVIEVVLSTDSLTKAPLSLCLVAESGYSAAITAVSGTVLVDSIVVTPSLREGVAQQLEVFSEEDVLRRYRSEGCILDQLLVGGANIPLSDPAFCERVTCSASFQLFNGALPCACDGVGSVNNMCDSYRGQCSCQPGFTGRQCDLCTLENGGAECQPCNCDVIGSLTGSCDRLGQCVCKPGIGGLKCNTCLTGYYNLTDEGCEECGCDDVGSVGVGCDEEGECECREGVRGRKCDECDEGYFNLTLTGCSPCPCPSVVPGSLFATGCEEVMGGGVRCVGCREGHGGDRCQFCAEGYVGDPTGEMTGSPVPCRLCECNGNVDPANSDPCDITTGACIGCLGNTAGDRCEQCALGYTGDAITAKNCTACPACYEQVAMEFNETLSRLSALLSELDSSMAVTGRLPEDLMQEVMNYQIIVEEMLSRARTLAIGERDITLGVGLVAMDADDLEDLIGQLERNVSQSEEGLARITMNSGPAARLLQQLEVTLGVVEGAVRGELLTGLREAQRQLATAQIAFDQLLELSSLANDTSTEQYELARTLFSDAMNASSMAQQSLQLLLEAVALQNETSVVIATLQETRVSFDVTVRDATSALREIEVSVPRTLSQARALLERVRNASITTYNTSSLEVRAATLRGQRDSLVSDTTAASSELEEVEREAAGVNERAALLIAESASINILAVELLGRAHAALSFANQTVEEGNEFISSVEQLLLDLQRRLTNSQGFVTGLEEVMQSVGRAEELAGEAEREGERRRGDVAQAAVTVGRAVLAMEEASQLTTQALQLAVRVREEARQGFSDASLLATTAGDLAANVSEARDTVTSLEGAVIGNTDTITMATETAQMATSDASRVQGEIDQLLDVLQELQVELDSAELLPGDRLSEVGSMVTELESRAESNQVIIDTLQNQVDQLVESSNELRERHTSLQQHRDLLQSILTNIQNLDCRNQFQSF